MPKITLRSLTTFKHSRVFDECMASYEEGRRLFHICANISVDDYLDFWYTIHQQTTIGDIATAIRKGRHLTIDEKVKI